MFPFGTMLSVPSNARTIVTRSVSASTVPATGSADVWSSTVSPTSYWFSARMKNPESVSRTIVCAPNPSATPAIPAVASSGPRFTPIDVRIISTTTLQTTIWNVLSSRFATVARRRACRSFSRSVPSASSAARSSSRRT